MWNIVLIPSPFVVFRDLFAGSVQQRLGWNVPA
jgi:hypothetical protein